MPSALLGALPTSVPSFSSSRNGVVAHSRRDGAVAHRPHRKRDPRFPGVYTSGFVLDRLPVAQPQHMDDAPQLASTTAGGPQESLLFSEFSTRELCTPSSLALGSSRRPPSGPGCAPQGLQQEALAQPVLRVTTEEKPQKTKNKERTPDYFANVGDAIRTLRDDIPELFNRELNYSIYRDDVVFKDPRFRFEGIKNYKLIFWSLRFHGRLFFSRLYVEIKRIWQPTDDVIKMRWTVHGIPRVPWEAEGVFDGVSTYKLDNAGRVYEHSVDNILLRDPPMLTSPPLLAGLNLVPNVPGLVPQQQPCPGAWYMPVPVTQLQHQHQPQQLPAQQHDNISGPEHSSRTPAWQPLLQSSLDSPLDHHTHTLDRPLDTPVVVLSRAAPLAGLPRPPHAAPPAAKRRTQSPRTCTPQRPSTRGGSMRSGRPPCGVTPRECDIITSCGGRGHQAGRCGGGGAGTRLPAALLTLRVLPILAGGHPWR